MANITQKINSYVHGMSMQPDHLKSPGQVRNLVNGLPDVMAGLVKRPGSEIIKELSTTKDGRWFNILRDANEKYIGKVTVNGFEIWTLLNGDTRDVKYSRTPGISDPTYVQFNELPYFKGMQPNDIDILTINDYSIVLNKNIPVGMGGITSDEPKYEGFILLNTLEYNAEYSVDLTEPDAGQTTDYKAAAISVNPSPRWSVRDDNAYSYAGTKTFTESSPDGTKTGLRFTITANPRWTGVPGYYDETTYDITYSLHNGGRGWRVGDQVTVNLNGKNYTITVTKESLATGYNSFASAYHLTPKDSSSGNVSINDVLTDIKAQLEAAPDVECTVIGPGIYIKYTKPFSIYASGGQTSYSMKAFTDTINDAGDLPAQCKDGYIVKVANSAADEDDYYMEFHGKEEGVDGTGVWEECVKPGIPISLDYDTMPHQLVRMSDGSFLLSPIEWENRLVGDEKTNPEPSFVGKTINRTLFYRNRLTFLSDENIIQSQSGDYFNFFVNTAMTVTDNDPIDLAATSTSPCELHDAIPMKIGLILFSRDRQFLYGTSLDLLSPTTAKIETLSTYDWNDRIKVADMGTTIGFISSAGAYSRFFELTNLESNNAPEALEQSKVVSELLPADLDLPELAQSKENTLLGFAKRDTNLIYMYRYFNDGSKRLMSSWFKWEITGNLQHHFIDKDIYYTVVEYLGDVFVTKHVLTIFAEDYLFEPSGFNYVPRLDLRYQVKRNELTYDKARNRTTFKLDWRAGSDLRAFVTEEGPYMGRSQPVASVNIDFVNNTTDVELEGDWSQHSVVVGYPYEFRVEIPTIYMSQDKGDNKVKSDTRSYLTVHRAKFQFADVGVFTTTVEARSKPDRVLQWEQNPGDHYRANRHSVQPLSFQTIPCYEKNEFLDFTLTSNHPTPAALLSMEWEGKLSPKSYRSV